MASAEETYLEEKEFFDYGNVFTAQKQDSLILNDPIRKDVSSNLSVYEYKLFAETLRAPPTEAADMTHE